MYYFMTVGTPPTCSRTQN